MEHGANLGALETGIPANPENVIETVDGVNHLFQHCRTGKFDEYREIEETIAPEVLERIVGWVAGVANGR